MRPEDVQTDGSVGVDVGMVDAGGEGELGGLEGVVCGEVDVEEEDSPLKGGVGGPEDCGLPMEGVITNRT